MNTIKRLLLGGLFLAGIGTADAATRYWNNGSGDSLWSNPANWTGGNKPVSNDTVRLDNDCPDAPQNIILDENAWLAQLACNATGSRDYTITPTSNQFIRLQSTYDISGSSSRTVNLVINSDILVGDDYLRVYGYGATVLNGNIRPSPGESASTYLLAQYGTVTVAGSNDVSHLIGYNNVHVVIRHPYATGGKRLEVTTSDEHMLVTLETNLVASAIHTKATYPIALRIAETEDRDINLDLITGQIQPGRLMVVPRGDNATGRLRIRVTEGGGIALGSIKLEDYSDLVFVNTKTTYLGSSNYSTGHGAISGPGRFIVDCDTKQVQVSSTNSYTGGTYIRSGTLNMIRSNVMPTNGAVYLSEGATFHSNNTSLQHEIGSLIGTGSVTHANLTLNHSLQPGGEGGFGTLAFSLSAKLTLTPECTTVFKLGNLGGEQDLVTMLHNGSTLAMDGKLKIVNAGGLEKGTYKLFDMLSKGKASGAFSSVEMPPAFSGTVEINPSNGDVYLHVKEHYSTQIIVR